MLETVETRWFFAGPPPEAVRRWHEGLTPALIDEPKRTDLYLRTGGLTTLGTKLRQGSVQFKARADDAEAVEFAPNATGTLASWRKWDFQAVDNAATLAPLFEDDAHWVRVLKKRAQHYFCWRRDRGLIEARAEAEATCGVELVATEVDDAPYWSLALEAAAPDRESGTLSGGSVELAREGLKAVAGHIFAQPGASTCPLGDSRSYPEWLHALAPTT